MHARFAASLAGEEPAEPRMVWVDQHRSQFEENISASSALVACRYFQPCPTQVISRRMPQVSERPSISPVNVVRVQANGTISPVINELGHESAVTLHRATYIERGWRYYCPVKNLTHLRPASRQARTFLDLIHHGSLVNCVARTVSGCCVHWFPCGLFISCRAWLDRQI